MNRYVIWFCVFALCFLIPAATAQAIGGDEGWIRVNCNVDGATVNFDGTYKCTISGGSCTVPVYSTGAPYNTVTVEKSGYTTYSGSLRMPAKGETVDVYATLNPIPTPVQYGSLYVTTSPQGAAIYLSGNYRGVSPLTISSLSPGAYPIRADLAGYQSESDTVTIYAGQQMTESFTLQRIVSPGTIFVTSYPPGAYMYMDGSYHGVTPLTLTNVAPGSHSLELDLSGYYDWKSTVTVGSGQTQTITATLTPLASKTGWILAASSPANANVYVDSVMKGVTPAVGTLTISDVSAGSHTVKFELSGYQPYSTTVNVAGDTYSHVSATLTPVNPPAPNTGTLVISTSPTGAEIYVDNIFRGYAPLTLNDIATGSHVVTAKMAGYSDATLDVTVQKGASMPVALALSPSAAPTKAGTPLAAVSLGALALAFCCFVAAWRS